MVARFHHADTRNSLKTSVSQVLVEVICTVYNEVFIVKQSEQRDDDNDGDDENNDKGGKKS